jgi:hypothetical protein
MDRRGMSSRSLITWVHLVGRCMSRESATISSGLGRGYRLGLDLPHDHHLLSSGCTREALRFGPTGIEGVFRVCAIPEFELVRESVGVVLEEERKKGEAVDVLLAFVWLLGCTTNALRCMSGVPRPPTPSLGWKR